MIKKVSFYSIMICLILFNLSCGLDNYIVMEDPVSQIIKKPEYNSIQFQERYFEFWLNNKNSDIAGLMYLGTDIYYKIYTSSSTLSSEVGVLESLASDIENSAKAPEKLMNATSSGGYGYQTLKAANINTSPLFPADDNDKHRVYIRLSDYQDNVSDAFSSKILLDGNNLNNSAGIVKPVRYKEGRTFNFGRKGDNDKKPDVSGEDFDVKGYSEPNDKVWYVAMFAVGVGRDATYANKYSNIVYLGAVSIDSSITDN